MKSILFILFLFFSSLSLVTANENSIKDADRRISELLTPQEEEEKEEENDTTSISCWVWRACG